MRPGEIITAFALGAMDGRNNKAARGGLPAGPLQSGRVLPEDPRPSRRADNAYTAKKRFYAFWFSNPERENLPPGGRVPVIITRHFCRKVDNPIQIKPYKPSTPTCREVEKSKNRPRLPAGQAESREKTNSRISQTPDSAAKGEKQL